MLSRQSQNEIIHLVDRNNLSVCILGQEAYRALSIQTVQTLGASDQYWQ